MTTSYRYTVTYRHSGSKTPETPETPLEFVDDKLLSEADARDEAESRIEREWGFPTAQYNYVIIAVTVEKVVTTFLYEYNGTAADLFDKRLDEPLGTYWVFCLDTENGSYYINMSPRVALMNAALQGAGNWTTWLYKETYYPKLRPQVKIGPSGKTASLEYMGRTYCVTLPLPKENK
jgi:hypothetical protein